MKALLAGLALLLCVATPATAKPPRPAIWGTVSHVSDGDTLWIKPEGEHQAPLKLRLAGIDAPERCQAHGEVARLALKARLMGRRVSVHTRAIDQHGRRRFEPRCPTVVAL